MKRVAFLPIVMVGLIASVGETVLAGPIHDRLLERKAVRGDTAARSERLQPTDAHAAGMRVLHDVPYGEDSQQRLDAYLPREAKNAPVIFMVHGGAWRMGDKSARAVVQNKVVRWVGRGFIFVSANYRLLPKADPLLQAEDIARALATAQARSGSWGGDPSKFILIGHSAGAHLVALLAAAPAKAAHAGTKPWLGTILLDSAALDVEQIMNESHARFYDTAFGDQRSYWRAASPFHALSASASPMLAVCSTRRRSSCSQARAFAARAASLGVTATLVGQNLSHREINETLGTPGAYTAAVERFMGILDPTIMRVLASAEGERGAE